MISRAEWQRARERATNLVDMAGILCAQRERDGIDVVDLGFGRLDTIGLQILTWLSTGLIAVKLLILTPGQTFPEHRHPAIGDYAGKEETIRGLWGDLQLYVPGKPTNDPIGEPPTFGAQYYTARREIVLAPGDQHTIAPNTWHWFQAGTSGAVAWSFSSRATDVQDDFMDPSAERETVVTD